MAESISQINQLLKDNYGYDGSSGQPNFRIFSCDQTEKRYEEFAVFNGSTYLRTDKEVKEVPKYAPEHKGRWVLERLLPTVGNPYLQMVVKLSYEPVWIFGAANSNPTPIWKGVRRLVENCLHGDPNAKPKSPRDLELEEEEKIKQERARALDIIQDESPFIPSMVHAGSGDFLDHENFKEKKDAAS